MIIPAKKEITSCKILKLGLVFIFYCGQFFLQVLAFRDIAPQAPIHILIIPKAKDGLTGLSKVSFDAFPLPNYCTSLLPIKSYYFFFSNSIFKFYLFVCKKCLSLMIWRNKWKQKSIKEKHHLKQIGIYQVANIITCGLIVVDVTSEVQPSWSANFCTSNHSWFEYIGSNWWL